MDEHERLDYYIRLKEHAKKNLGQITTISSKAIVVFYSNKKEKRYSKYLFNPDFDDSLKNVVEYDSLPQLSNL